MSQTLANPSVTTTRDRILQAAMTCFARSGFHGASMQSICAEARISPGALYRHFDSKEGIIAAIAERELERVTPFFDALAAADDPVEALLTAGIDALAGLLTDRMSPLCAESIAEAIRNPIISAALRRNHDAVRAAVVGALRRGQLNGSVDPALDPEMACHVLMALGDGLSAHQEIDPSVPFHRLRPALMALFSRFLRPGATS